MRLQLDRPPRSDRALLLCVIGVSLCLPFLNFSSSRAQAPESEPEPPPSGYSAPAAAPSSAASAAGAAGDAERGPPALRGSVDARTGVYQDSDHTTISTTVVAGRATIRERGDIEARYLVDVVSSASIDVVTAATSTFRDTRHEVSVGGGYHDGTSTLNAGYIFSRENDWQSHTANLGMSRDFLQQEVAIERD